MEIPYIGSDSQVHYTQVNDEVNLFATANQNQNADTNLQQLASNYALLQALQTTVSQLS